MRLNRYLYQPGLNIDPAKSHPENPFQHWECVTAADASRVRGQGASEVTRKVGPPSSELSCIPCNDTLRLVAEPES